MSKLGQWVLNITAGVFFFFLFFLFMFPFDSIVQYFLSQVETNTNGAYRITVSEIKPSLLFKTVFKNFQLHHRGQNGDEIWIDMPEVRVGFHYLPLLAHRFQASFVAKGKKGEMDGHFSLLFSDLSLTEGDFSTEIDGIQFSDLPFLYTGVGDSLVGSIDGKIDLSLDSDHVNRNSGLIELKFKNVSMPAGRFSPYPGFDIDLPDTVLTDAKGGIFSAKMDAGKMEIKAVSLTGGDLILNLAGKLQINKKLPLSRFNLDGTFQLSKKLEDAFPFIIVVDKQKNEDGSYPISFSGHFSKVQIQVGTFEVLK